MHYSALSGMIHLMLDSIQHPRARDGLMLDSIQRSQAKEGLKLESIQRSQAKAEVMLKTSGPNYSSCHLSALSRRDIITS